jgi:hypothetical protein
MSPDHQNVGRLGTDLFGKTYSHGQRMSNLGAQDGGKREIL